MHDVDAEGCDDAHDDHDDHDDTAIFTLGDGTARVEQPELHRLLKNLADGVATTPNRDFYPRVLKRAAVIRRRRRAVRASTVTAVLVAAAVLAPSMAHRLGMRGGTAVAAPPAAVVDLASAYPAAEPASEPMRAVTPAQPANALDWSPRGVVLPDSATDLAQSYLMDRGARGDRDGQSNQDGDSGSASVTTLWAGLEDDTTAVVDGRVAGALVGGADVNGSPERLVAQTAHRTWLFVMQGWTVGPDGAPTSQAELLVGEYKESADGTPDNADAAAAAAGAEGAAEADAAPTDGTPTTSMTVRATPITFTHARPGSGDDKDDTQQIAELSVWLPDSGLLLVLGAPQTKTVLYAKTGGDLIPQKTVDGVALFPRTKSLVKGRYADTIQVRDAKNVALTPPKAWNAADFALAGSVYAWVSTAPGWVPVEVATAVPSRMASTLPPEVPVPSPSTSAPPAKVPSPARSGGKPPSTLPASPQPPPR